MAIGDGALFGYASSIAIGKELTFSTKASSGTFKFVEFNSESMKREQEEKKLESINTTRDFIRRMSLNRSVSGSLELDYNPAADACVYLLWNAMGGTLTTATLTVNNTWQHTIRTGDMESNHASASAYMKGLSLQIDKGGRVWDFLGCRVNTFSIKAEVGNPIVMTAELVGRYATLSSTTPTAVFTNIIPLDFTGITFKTGGTTTSLTTETIQSFELTINNNITTDQRSLGSPDVNILPPLRREVNLKVSQRFDTTTAYNAFINSSSTAIEITLDSGILLTSTATEKYNTVFTLPYCFVNNMMPDVGGFDVLKQELNFSCIANNTTTGYAIQATVNNLTASY